MQSTNHFVDSTEKNAHPPQLKIAIDARWITEKTSGIARYTGALIDHLPRVDSDSGYILLCDRKPLFDRLHDQFSETPKVNPILLGYGPYSPRNHLLLPRLLERLGADVFHSPNFMLPLRRFRGKYIITIHDMIPFLSASYAPRAKKQRLFFLYRAMTRRVARLAHRVITVSQNSASDIMRYLGVPADKIIVIHNGINLDRFAAQSGQESGFLRSKFGIDKKYVLAVGRHDPYKNVLGLIKAFSEIEEAGHVLLIVGELDKRYPEPLNFVREHKLEEKVIFAGHLSDDDLLRAYREADLFVHASLYEGFGLPPLEAMAAGTPVLSSSAASLPEVLGDAAIFFDPTDTAEIAKAIKRVLSDEKLRGDLAARGLRRAQEFSWERTALETAAVYKE